MNRLNELEQSKLLQTLSHWSVVNGELYKMKKFKNFNEVVIFFNQLAALAERMNHHPDLRIGYNYCEIKIITHDAGALTNLDFELAKAIDDIQ
jgi:4a-hydroxytetrahydrobiopterin dehydratase